MEAEVTNKERYSLLIKDPRVIDEPHSNQVGWSTGNGASSADVCGKADGDDQSLGDAFAGTGHALEVDRRLRT